MNITELARILKTTPQELRDALPEMGFSIGQKAIKVNNNTAKKIMKKWPQYKEQKELEEEQRRKEAQEDQEEEEQEIKEVKIPKYITVREFADLANISVNNILKELMKNGVFVSMNEKIDFDTASIVGSELNLEVVLDEGKGEEEEEEEDKKAKLKGIIEKEGESATQRAPVIVVMGHVDHGKTKLLDSIRKTNVTSEESGGITQHIGAYQVEKNNNWITFIDTPGHEAFTAMRSRGAQVADIAILVVAADDGVKPQTIEAYRLIEKSKIPFLVAINKMDKEGADVNRVKQELSSKLNILPEDWGGKIICVPISAIKGEGVDQLLEMVLLLAETESSDLIANPTGHGVGAIIESHVDKAAGPVATILMQNGTLKVGDQLSFNNILYGKVKALFNYKGENIKEAGPSVPAQVLGLKIAPEVGDVLEVGGGKRIKDKQLKFKATKGYETQTTSEQSEEGEGASILNLIIKSDVLGSAEAIEESLVKISGEKVKVNILTKSLGNVTENDVKRAENSDAQIIAFNVNVDTQIEKLIREKGIELKKFSIIYDLIEYIKEEMKKIIKPEIVKTDQGKLKVLKVFKTGNKNQILGGKVIEGEIKKDALIEVTKDKKIVAKGKLTNLQAGKQEVNSVEKDQECGIEYEGQPVIEEGDILNFYQEEKVAGKI